MPYRSLRETTCRHVDGSCLFELPLAHKTLRLHAGSYRGALAGGYDLVIDLADALSPLAQGHHLDPVMEAWTGSRQATSLLKLAWPDQQVPHLEHQDWLDLSRSLLESRYERVYAGCLGGHGRTGTFLAIVGCCLTELGERGIPERANPIAWV
ncbi:MAG TPA: protein-tyrosine phosphatase family protein, partial [Trueperaceae bacterium]